MAMNRKRIALISVNQFNPFLCDGVSNSVFELLSFLQGKGNDVLLLNFYTQEPYKKSLFQYLLDTVDSQTIYQAGERYQVRFRGLPILQEILPFGQNDLQNHYEDFLKHMVETINQKHIDYAITLEDCFVSLLSVSILGIPGAHFFHSCPCLKRGMDNPFFRRVLRKRTVFVVSRFLQKKLEKSSRIRAVVWPPIIDLGRFLVKKRPNRPHAIGFYSSGAHKGDEIIHQIIQKRTDYPFIVVGRNYEKGFKKPVSNLNWFGDLNDMQAFYGQIRLLVVPSIIEEAFSRVILEAAVNGIPVIANRVGGIPEALGESGVLVDIDLKREIAPDELADQYIAEIDRLLEDRGLYAAYSQRALQRAREYEAEQGERNEWIYGRTIHG
jgi:glycosyltransferase involved in cell wall biosynthesis